MSKKQHLCWQHSNNTFVVAHAPGQEAKAAARCPEPLQTRPPTPAERSPVPPNTNSSPPMMCRLAPQRRQSRERRDSTCPQMRKLSQLAQPRFGGGAATQTSLVSPWNWSSLVARRKLDCDILPAHVATCETGATIPSFAFENIIGNRHFARLNRRSA